LSHALATEPEQPSSTASQPAQASSPPPQAAATTPPAQQRPDAKPPIAAPSSTAATTVASKGDQTPVATGKVTPELIKQAHGLGYKVKTRGADVYFCRQEAKMGSRFETEACVMPDEIDLIARRTQEMVQKAQRIGMPPVN
jgi:hypothetical protein